MGIGTVSVIVPTHNREQRLAEALESISAQTYANIETIVVNDGGRDVFEVVERTRGKLRPGHSIRLFSHCSRRGVAAARNTALKAAAGEWIAYLDDDDLYLPGHLEEIISALTASNSVFGYSDLIESKHTLEAGVFTETERVEAVSPEFDRERLTLENYIRTCCVVHKAECLERCGVFDEALVALEDWELWFRISRHYDFLHVPGASCEVRHIRNETSISGGHTQGYAWAALNCLYKLMAALPGREDLQTIYRAKVTEAIEHLKLQVCYRWQQPENQRGPFLSGQNPRDMLNRLDQLKSLYAFDLSQFEELCGLICVELKDLGEARVRLERACKADPENTTAAEFYGFLVSSLQ